MNYKVLIFVILVALYGVCAGYQKWTDSWCECMWAQDSTYFDDAR